MLDIARGVAQCALIHALELHLRRRFGLDVLGQLFGAIALRQKLDYQVL